MKIMCSKVLENDSKWEVLLTVTLSEENKIKGHVKYVNLKRFGDLCLVDIRSYMNNKPTVTGVCLTSFEFDWLTKSLLYKRYDELSLTNKSKTRYLAIKRKLNNVGFEVTQRVNDKTRHINLYKSEIATLLKECGSFLCLLENYEEQFMEQMETKDEETDEPEKSLPEDYHNGEIATSS
jgi:hypothetical protein